MAIDFDEAIRRTQGSMEQREAKPPAEPPRTPKHGPSRPRRKTVMDYYHEMATRGALGATFLLWFSLWALDGYFTVLFLSALFPAIPWYVGGLIHLGVSFIQNYLWKAGRRDLLTLGVVLLFNIGTSAVGALAQLAAWTTPRPWALLDIATLNIPQSSALTIIGLVLAVVVAVIPERQARKYGEELFER